MTQAATSLYEFISAAVPESRTFLNDLPEWYKQEMNYGIARWLLSFTLDLRNRHAVADVARVMKRVEQGMREPEHISSGLCLDFIQPIADLEADERTELVANLGPMARACYDLQNKYRNSEPAAELSSLELIRLP